MPRDSLVGRSGLTRDDFSVNIGYLSQFGLGRGVMVCVGVQERRQVRIARLECVETLPVLIKWDGMPGFLFL